MTTWAWTAWMPTWSASLMAKNHGHGRSADLMVWRRGLGSWNPKHAKRFFIRNPKRLPAPIGGLHIDRKNHLDQSWRRQQEEEARQAEAEVTCPVDCVREVYNCAEFEKVLQDAETTNDLVVVDFYNSSCGACKYILPQFVKLCKKGCAEEECDVEARPGVVFVKHNVRDEYDDLTVANVSSPVDNKQDMARFYSIRHVPMFSFFMDGSRVEQFPTRDRARLEDSISRLLSRFIQYDHPPV